MKKLLCLIVCAVMVAVSFSSCGDPSEGGGDYPKDYNLVIDGERMKSDNVKKLVVSKYGDEEVCVPLIETLEYFGFSVEWTTDLTATISKNGAVYYLDTENETLVEEGDDSNILEFDTYTTACIFENKEVLMQWYCYEDAMERLGVLLYCRSFEEIEDGYFKTYNKGKDSIAYILTHLTEEDKELYNASINGRRVSLDGVYEYQAEDDPFPLTMIPIISLFEEMGYDVKQKSDNEYVIKLDTER